MQIVTATEYGDPWVLRLEEQPAPTADSGEVVVQVKAAGVNLMDSYARRGMIDAFELPLRLGVDGAGIVTEVGEHANFKVGDRVVWERAPGTYAEMVAVPAKYVVPIPETVSFQAAAGGLMQGLTAHHLCYEAVPVPQGATVLVHSAAGGVGRMLVQLIARRGGHVIATVSKRHKADSALRAGASAVLVRDDVGDLAAAVSDLTEGEGVDIVFDGTGRALFDASLASLRFGGIFVHYGRAGGAIPPIDLWSQPDGVHLVRVYGNASHESPADWRRRATQVVDWIKDGTLEVHLHQSYQLEDAARAHSDLESQNTVGKLLILP